MSDADLLHHYKVLKQFLDISDDSNLRAKSNRQEQHVPEKSSFGYRAPNFENSAQMCMTSYAVALTRAVPSLISCSPS